MQHLFEAWESIKFKIKRQNISLFLDYDGTLTPIVARPSLAKLSERERVLLKQLSSLPGVEVAVISGRRLKDVRSRVGLPGLLYAGNHGLEINGPKIRYVHPTAQDFRKLAKELVLKLRLAYTFLPEILIEEKIFSVAIHYRQIRPEKIDFAKIILYRQIGQYLSDGRAILIEGKKVWEIRPATEWNKGRTVLWLLATHMAHQERKVLPIYIGDDLTDEDAFRALKKRGITIKVGDEYKNSEAQYYLSSPSEVYKFLNRLIYWKK